MTNKHKLLRILKVKAFIYRFSDIFGFRLYLAEKEENEYIKSLGDIDDFEKDLNIGLWQAKHGFTTIFTVNKKYFSSIKSKIKHAFNILV